MWITFLFDSSVVGYCYANSGVSLPRPYKYINLVFFWTNWTVNPLISYLEIATSAEQRPDLYAQPFEGHHCYAFGVSPLFSLFLLLNKKVGLILEQAFPLKWKDGTVGGERGLMIQITGNVADGSHLSPSLFLFPFSVPFLGIFWGLKYVSSSPAVAWLFCFLN